MDETGISPHEILMKYRTNGIIISMFQIKTQNYNNEKLVQKIFDLKNKKNYSCNMNCVKIATLN